MRKMHDKLVKRPANELNRDNHDKLLAQLQPGDHVWVGRSGFPCSDGIKLVDRITKTQIVVKSNENYEMRFGRITGYRIGGGSFSNHITGIATHQEVVEYEEELQRKADEAAQARAKRERTQEKQKELNLLFHHDHRIYVQADEDGWTVRFARLTEQEVVDLAVKIQ
jgi:preprotein translocase subunit YajC